MSYGALCPVLPELPCEQVEAYLMSGVPPRAVFLPAKVGCFVTSGNSPVGKAICGTIGASSRVPA